VRKILLVDDAEDIQSISRSLFRSDFKLQIASTLVDAERFAFDLNNKPDLIILDIGMPDGDGLAFCAKLKTTHHTQSIPIIILSGRSDIAAKVAGFSIGAEDYMVKPFEPIELLLRSKAWLLRSLKEKTGSRSWIKENLRVDTDSQDVWKISDNGEVRFQLTFIDFKLLSYLIKHEGTVLSRDQLIATAWGNETFFGSRTVDVHISQLRKKLAEMNCVDWSLNSIHRVGYKLQFTRPIDSKRTAEAAETVDQIDNKSNK
jgi:DNA-binding response OmpR family regulator